MDFASSITELYADFKLNDNQMRGVASELMHNTVLLTLDASGAALTREGCCSQRCEHVCNRSKLRRRVPSRARSIAWHERHTQGARACACVRLPFGVGSTDVKRQTLSSARNRSSLRGFIITPRRRGCREQGYRRWACGDRTRDWAQLCAVSLGPLMYVPAPRRAAWRACVSVCVHACACVRARACGGR